VLFELLHRGSSTGSYLLGFLLAQAGAHSVMGETERAASTQARTEPAPAPAPAIALAAADRPPVVAAAAAIAAPRLVVPPPCWMFKPCSIVDAGSSCHRIVLVLPNTAQDRLRRFGLSTLTLREPSFFGFFPHTSFQTHSRSHHAQAPAPLAARYIWPL
jgi:hypothetical protein